MHFKLKHKLPVCATLDHLELKQETLAKLQACVADSDARFVSVYDVNKSLCGIHDVLASNVYNNFFQIALTTSTFAEQSDACDAATSELQRLSKSQAVRRRKELTSESASPFNERTYTEKTPFYEKYGDLFDEVLENVKGKKARIRLVKLAAKTTVPPHIDYDPSYAVRIIVPIISSPECINVFWVKNTIQSFFLKPGKAYFLNTGYKHAVVNMSDKDRYTFMITIDGTDDIQHLIY